MLSQDEHDTVAPKIYAPEEFRDLDVSKRPWLSCKGGRHTHRLPGWGEVHTEEETPDGER